VTLPGRGTSPDKAAGEIELCLRMADQIHAPDVRSGRTVEEDIGAPFIAALRASRIPMLVTDPRQPDNPIVLVNDAFLSLTGYSQTEILGRNCRFLQAPATDPAEADGRHLAFTSEQGVAAEVLSYRKDGTPFWGDLFISPVHDSGGRLMHHVVSYIDVSERREARSALQRAKREGEAERRRAEELQTVLDEKTRLLQQLDHRVKNNLQIISSLVLLKARRVQDLSAQHVLNTMAERIGALSLVDRLLYPIADARRFDVAEFIRILSNDLVSTAEPDQIALALDLESIVVPPGQAASLALILNELITNAVRHAFPNGRTGLLTLRTRQMDEGARIVVQDDGVGMGGAPQSFDGFGRVLVEMMVRQVRARISWEDAGPGTCVVVTVPLEADGASH
jgi:PAS domain S-box-containing protein